MKNENRSDVGMDEVERVRRQVEAVRERIRQMSQTEGENHNETVSF